MLDICMAMYVDIHDCFLADLPIDNDALRSASGGVVQADNVRVHVSPASERVLVLKLVLYVPHVAFQMKCRNAVVCFSANGVPKASNTICSPLRSHTASQLVYVESYSIAVDMAACALCPARLGICSPTHALFRFDVAVAPLRRARVLNSTKMQFAASVNTESVMSCAFL